MRTGSARGSRRRQSWLSVVAVAVGLNFAGVAICVEIAPPPHGQATADRGFLDTRAASRRPLDRATGASPGDMVGPIGEPIIPNGESIIPDSFGAIAEVLLHYDDDLATELEPVYRVLFTTLPKDVRLRILCPSDAAAGQLLRDWQGLLDGREVDIINLGMPLTIWSRDRCVARQSSDLLRRGAGFVPSPDDGYCEEKYNEIEALRVMNSAGLIRTLAQGPLQLEGGNIVANRRHVFVGANVLEDNRPNLPLVDIYGALAATLGRPYILVGGEDGETPWFHADMFLTPIDDRTILVANTVLGRDLARMQDQQIGRLPGCETHADGDSKEHSWDEKSAAVARNLDAAAAVMKTNGYEVFRLPAMANQADEWMISYNNVLLDEHDGRRIAYMPVYGQPMLDSVAESVYRSLGFEVYRIDVSSFYRLGGAIRCVANVTERRPVPLAGPRLTQDKRGKIRVIAFTPRRRVA